MDPQTTNLAETQLTPLTQNPVYTPLRNLRQSQVEAHIRSFMRRENPTTESKFVPLNQADMTHQMYRYGIQDRTVPWVAQTIMSVFSKNELTPTPANLVKLTNPASTGIWDKAGYFDPKQFKRLAQKAVLINGELLITHAIYRNFMLEQMAQNSHKIYNSPGGFFMFGCLPIHLSWRTISLNTGRLLFKNFANRHITLDGAKHAAFTLDRLEEFYTQPGEFVRKYANEPTRSYRCPFRLV